MDHPGRIPEAGGGQADGGADPPCHRRAHGREPVVPDVRRQPPQVRALGGGPRHVDQRGSGDGGDNSQRQRDGCAGRHATPAEHPQGTPQHRDGRQGGTDLGPEHGGQSHDDDDREDDGHLSDRSGPVFPAIEVQAGPQQGRRGENRQRGVAQPKEPGRGVQRISEDAPRLQPASRPDVDDDDHPRGGEERLQGSQHPPPRSPACSPQRQRTRGQGRVDGHEYRDAPRDSQARDARHRTPGVGGEREGGHSDGTQPGPASHVGGVPPAQPPPQPGQGHGHEQEGLERDEHDRHREVDRLPVGGLPIQRREAAQVDRPGPCPKGVARHPRAHRHIQVRQHGGGHIGEGHQPPPVRGRRGQLSVGHSWAADHHRREAPLPPRRVDAHHHEDGVGRQGARQLADEPVRPRQRVQPQPGRDVRGRLHGHGRLAVHVAPVHGHHVGPLELGEGAGHDPGPVRRYPAGGGGLLREQRGAVDASAVDRSRAVGQRQRHRPRRLSAIQVRAADDRGVAPRRVQRVPQRPHRRGQVSPAGAAGHVGQPDHGHPCDQPAVGGRGQGCARGSALEGGGRVEGETTRRARWHAAARAQAGVGLDRAGPARHGAHVQSSHRAPPGQGRHLR